MSKFTISNLLFAIIVLIMLRQVQYEGISVWLLVIPISIYLLALIIGSASIKLNFHFRSLNNAPENEKTVALTFDDGPNPNFTRQLLQLLKKHQAKACFFLIGENIAKNGSIVKQIIAEGHLIGNHSYTHHRYFDLFSSKKMTDEITATNSIIKKTCQLTPLLFRPPYGVTNPALKKAIMQTGMISVGWSLRSFDTMKDKEKVLNKLKRKTKSGDVVLFHDNDEKIFWIIEEYLLWLKQQQFKVVNLESLFNINAYEAD